MTELERSIVDAGNRYNELMRKVKRGDVTNDGREHISHIQRRIARHYHRLVPSAVSADYQTALNVPETLATSSLDPAKPIDQCIVAGDTYAALFEKLTSISPGFSSQLDLLFTDNGFAFDNIVGFETYDPQAPASPPTS